VEKQQNLLQSLLDTRDGKMFVKVEGVLDLYRNQNKVLYNRELEASYQEFWNKIVNKDVPAAFEKMQTMVKNVELFTEKHWNKISNIADQ
jgi:hypothetical protein